MAPRSSAGQLPELQFPNYLEMPAQLPPRFWLIARSLALGTYLVLIVGLIVRPATTLNLFWGIGVPTLPVLFLVAPGTWRNVCPLAAANQTARVTGASRSAAPPDWLREYGFAIATSLFISIVLLRKVLLTRNGPATATVLALVVVAAAAGGYLLKGKSGWCSSICPLLPVQRVYGQAPFVGVANAHCRPCVGCTKNCYDFNPKVSYVADMVDGDPAFRGHRRLFVGAFPGLVVGYFLVPDAGRLSVVETFGRTLLWIAGSVALFSALDTYGRFSANTLPPLFGAAAFTTFYWYGAPRFADSLTTAVDGSWSWTIWPVRLITIGLAVVWLGRARMIQRRFVDEVADGVTVRVDLGAARRAGGGPAADEIEIAFADGPTVPVAVGVSLLEAAEGAKLEIASGCRMGVCGADPVAVLEGMGELSPIRREEADTLERLGLGGPNRLACVARAHGSCSVSLTPDTSASAIISAPRFAPDPSVRRVVIVGHGVAGVTVADFLRRAHPDCEIDIVGAEPHHLYNRMAIGRLIHGRQAMQGLYLLPDDWSDRHRITSWLNTRVTSFDREARTVRLGTGELLPYDRLVLATGAESTVPDIEGFGLPGTFVLREAADAMRLRQHVQGLTRRTAVVAGGGLLGLEAAHALHRIGLSVVVAERSDRLLRRALDPAGSDVLEAYLESEGIRVSTKLRLRSVGGEGQVAHAVADDGRVLPCDVLLVAAGITPSTALARAAGLEVARGVVVDEQLRTTDPAVFAVGDVAERDGRVWGLWPVAVAQAKAAATNIAGGEASFHGEAPLTMLKGVGIDVVSFGRIEAGVDDRVAVVRPSGEHSYRKLVLRDRQVVGGVFLGHPEHAVIAQEWYLGRRRLDDPELAEHGWAIDGPVVAGDP